MFFFLFAIVHYNVAREGEDFSGLPNIITFASGDIEGTISCKNITIIDDNVREEMENFTVKLSSNFTGVSVSRSLSVVEISDNDEGIYII